MGVLERRGEDLFSPPHSNVTFQFKFGGEGRPYGTTVRYPISKKEIWVMGGIGA